MDKETLIQTLRDKVGETDFAVLSDRTIDNIVTPLLPMFSDDEKITDESYNLPLGILKSYIGQYRHDIAEGIKNGKASWEEEQKESVSKKIAEEIEKAKKEWESKNDTSKDTDSIKEKDAHLTAEEITQKVIESLTGKGGALEKLTGTFSKFMEDYSEERKQKKMSQTRDVLRDYLIEHLGADRMPVVNLAIQDIEISDDSDIDSLKKDVKEKYEARYKEFYGDMPLSVRDGAYGAGDSVDEFKQYMKELEQREADSARDAEALKSQLI